MQQQQERRNDNEDLKQFRFRCRRCGLSQEAHFFGKGKPRFCRGQLEVTEPSYLMLDPFSPRVAGKANFLLLGGICVVCEAKEEEEEGDGSGIAAESASVCVDCSVFYSKRFCVDCAAENIRYFPVEVQAKIRRKTTTS